MNEERLLGIKDRVARPLINALGSPMTYMAESRRDISELVAEVERLEEIAYALNVFNESKQRIVEKQSEEIARLRKALEAISDEFDMCYRRKPSNEPQFYHCLEAERITKEALQHGK